jgi:hypothetical protein
MNKEAFQFFKFHGVGRYTALNMIPTYFGVYNIYYNGKYFLKDYKNAGYITGQAIDCCTREVFDIDGGAIERMEWVNYDHENISLFCDTNYVPYNEINSLFRGANSIRRRCLYNNNPSVYALEYMNQFFAKYKDEPKFFRVGLADGHDGTAEVIKYSDDILADFFNKFEKEGHLDDTLLIISTDHGFSLPGPYSIPQLEDWDIESVLPTLFVIAPTSMKDFEKVKSTLKANEQKMITPFNLYNSLKAILGDNSLSTSMQGDEDIFTDRFEDERDCMNFFDFLNYQGSISNMICRCSAK